MKKRVIYLVCACCTALLVACGSSTDSENTGSSINTGENGEANSAIVVNESTSAESTDAEEADTEAMDADAESAPADAEDSAGAELSVDEIRGTLEASDVMTSTDVATDTTGVTSTDMATDTMEADTQLPESVVTDVITGTDDVETTDAPETLTENEEVDVPETISETEEGAPETITDVVTETTNITDDSGEVVPETITEVEEEVVPETITEDENGEVSELVEPDDDVLPAGGMSETVDGSELAPVDPASAVDPAPVADAVDDGAPLQEFSFQIQSGRTGKSVANVYTILESETATGVSGTSDPTGRIAFQGVDPNADYTVSFAVPGFENISYPVTSDQINRTIPIKLYDIWNVELLEGATYNIRTGPASYYGSLGLALGGEVYNILGRSDNADWLVIRTPYTTSPQSWILYNEFEMSLTGSIEDFPVMQFIESYE